MGFAGATGRTVPLAATRVYQMSFFTGFGVSAIIYYVLNRLFPVPGAFQKWEEVDESMYSYVPGHEEEGARKEGESDKGSVKKDKLDDEVVVETLPAGK